VTKLQLVHINEELIYIGRWRTKSLLFINKKCYTRGNKNCKYYELRGEKTLITKGYQCFGPPCMW